MEKVVIFGASGHAKVTIDILEKSGKYEIIGLLDSNKNIGPDVLGFKIWGGTDVVPELLKKFPGLKFFIAIGDNWRRSKIAQELLKIEPNIQFINAIHPSAILGKNVSLGRGIMIMAGAIINADSVIGDFTIINTKASVGHESTIMEYSSVAPNSTLGGNVTVGRYSAISISATILNGGSVGEHTVIGAGALLTKDADSFSVYYGVPAKFIRPRELGEKYL
ncbi:acetyltransferase [Allomuricauda sp. M10]|uniref:acetyltransferase n=1 Tax=Allomuricauda sp. M10 TaxID=2683292 RepID=UPI001D1851BB|nr:acetyltransferase [Muricauda sp. M10]